MTDAPEKIWVVEGLCEILSFNTYDNGGPSYIRTDLHLALVAAERERCADCVTEAKLAKAVEAIDRALWEMDTALKELKGETE